MAMERFESRTELLRIREPHEFKAGGSVICLPLSMRIDSLSSGLPLSTLYRDLKVSNFPTNNLSLMTSQIRNAANRAAIIPPRPTRRIVTRTEEELMRSKIEKDKAIILHSLAPRSTYERDLRLIREEINNSETFSRNLNRFAQKNEEIFHKRRYLREIEVDTRSSSKIVEEELKKLDSLQNKQKLNNRPRSSFFNLRKKSTPVSKTSTKKEETTDSSDDLMTNEEFQKLFKQ